MTVLELRTWINMNNPFYHVTLSSNISSILKEGLCWGKDNPFGICVIRNNNATILEYLCVKMLKTSKESTFSVIKIEPFKHHIREYEVLGDSVDEITVDLHNYITKKKLIIEPDDIIDTISIDSSNPELVFELEEQVLKIIDKKNNNPSI